MIGGNRTGGRQQRATEMFSCLLIIVLVIACDGTDSPSPIPMQTFSPLPLTLAAQLVGPRWKITGITFHEEAIQFTALQSVQIWFDPAGTLTYGTPFCSGGAFLIFFESATQYKLGQGDAAPVECKETAMSQYARVTEALAATTAYTIEGNQLLLTGEDVRIELEIDNQP